MGRRKEKSLVQNEDVHERRKTQNRIAQRHYRERQKQCLENAHKLLLAHEAVKNRCRVIGSGNRASFLGSPLEESMESAMNIEAALADVPAEVRQALLRFDSRRDSDLGNGAIFGNLDFKATEVDLVLPTRIEDSPSEPSNDTVNVRVNKPQINNDAPLHIEAIESFSPVSPSDFFQLSPPPISDTFDPLPDINSVPSSVPSTYIDINTPPKSQSTSETGLKEGNRQNSGNFLTIARNSNQSGLTKDVAVSPESQLARPSCSAGNHNEVATGGRSKPQVDDDEWSTPLLAAAARGHAGMVRLLVQNGADLETKSKSGKTSLYWAVEMGQIETVKCCLELGANLGAAEDESGMSLFHRSIMDGDIFLLKTLLDYCARQGEKGREWIHKTDRRNRTPLYLAAEMGKTEIAELFIKAGADINRR